MHSLTALVFMATVAAASTEPAPDAAAAVSTPDAFTWGDFTWMNGQSKQKSFPLTLSQYFGASAYLDMYYAFSNNAPLDNTLTGTASVARHNEFQINLVSFGFDFNYRQAFGRFSVQFGNQLNITQDLDMTPLRGRGLTTQNLRYIREATLGYHFNVLNGVNVEGGIFMSYIGLDSYLVAENWNYTRSLASDHTPFYFQGIRAQIFPTASIKIEPWLMNGWQTYGKYNFSPSGGLAFRYQPLEALGMFANFYVGTDTPGQAQRVRFHHDTSVVWRLLELTQAPITRVALSLNLHAGFESGGAGLPGPGRAHFLASTLAVRTWFAGDLFAVCARGEIFKNGTSYLRQFAPPDLPPDVNLVVWGLTGTLEFMPRDYFSLRAEVVWRESNQRYFAGPGGTTSVTGLQGDSVANWVPDTVKSQTMVVIAANFRL